MGLAACGASSSTGGGTTTVAAQKPSKKPSELIVRTWADPWRSTFTDGPAKAFTAETGIPVRWDLTDEAPIQTKIRQAIQAGSRPPVDVVNNLGTWAYLSAAQDMIVPLNPAIVTNLNSVIDEVAKPTSAIPVTDAGWPYVSIYTYSIPVIYDADKVQPSSVKSWLDLFKPEFNNALGMDDYYYNITFPLAKTLGVDPKTDPSLDPVWKKLATLKPNIAAIANTEAMSKLLASGQIEIFLGLVGNGQAAQDLGANAKWLVPKEGAYLGRDSAYVLKNLPPETTYYGQVFINHLLEAQTQNLFAQKLGVVPVYAKAKLPHFMQGDPAFPFTSDQIKKYAIVVPEDEQAKGQTQWQARYDQTIK
jgi:putative spermidine/putrescine transport system substrate-binding protein